MNSALFRIGSLLGFSQIHDAVAGQRWADELVDDDDVARTVILEGPSGPGRIYQRV